MSATPSRAGSPPAASATSTGRNKDEEEAAPLGPVAETPEKEEEEGEGEEKLSVGPSDENPFGLQPNIYYSNQDGEFDVILIHGLRDDANKVFKKDSAQYPWVSGDLMGFVGWGHLSFRYNNSSSEAPIFSGDGLNTLARQLLDELVKLREQREDHLQKQRPILFVTRDLGGVIAKHALLMAAREPATFSKVALNTTLMVFFDCPQTLSRLEQAQNWLWDHMPRSGSGPAHGFIGVLMRLAEDIYESTNDVSRSNLLAATANFNYVSSNSFDTDLELEFLANTTTWSPNPFDCNARFLSDTDTARGFSLSDVDIDFGDKIARHDALPFESDVKLPPRRFDLLARCPPAWLSESSSSWDGPLWAWLKEQQEFQSWIQFTYPRRGFRALHLRGNTARLAHLSHLVYLGVHSTMPGWNWQTTFYFQFQRRDHRRNTMHSMLVSFITQLCQGVGAWNKVVPRGFDIIFDFEAFTLNDLMQCWEDFTWSLEGDINRMVFIIGSVDQCTDDVTWFLDRLRHREENYREDPMEVLFTSQGDTNYGSYPTIDLDQFMTLHKQHYRDAAYGDLSESLQKLAQRHHFTTEARTKIDVAMRSCGDDVQRGQMMLEWVSLRRQQLVSEDKIFENFDSLSTASPLSLFRSLQELYPESLQAFSQAAISLVQHALRPLKLVELASALSVSDDLDDRREPDLGLTLERLHQLTPGLLVVRFGEVFLAHDQLVTKMDDEMTSATSQHAAITRRCLKYLQLDSTQSDLRRMVDQGSTAMLSVFPERNSWARYAVWHLATHYKLAGSETPSNEMRSFFESKTTRDIWSEAYLALSHSCMRVVQGYVSPLPVLARAGLHDLLIQIAEESERNDPTAFSIDCSLALEEAARRGDTATVRFLMDKSLPEAKVMGDIMKSAAVKGDAELLEYLFDRARSLSGFSPPLRILFCASYRGFDSVLKLVFEYDPDAQQRLLELSEVSALNTAIRARQYGACKILLEHGSLDINKAMDTFGWLPLQAAVTWGHPGIVQLLVEKGADMTLEDWDKARPLQEAVSRGSFAAVETLLKHGAELSWTVDEDHNSTWNHGVPLYTAANLGYPRAARVLLDHGAKASAMSCQGSPINGAALSSNTAMVKMLLEAGEVDVNLTVSSQKPPLLAAVSEHNIDVARLLLEAGADPNYTSESAELPLCLATREGTPEMVELLLAKGADIEKKCLEAVKGWPPVRYAYVWAAGIKNDNMFHLLRARGPKINREWDGEWSPLFHAAYYGQDSRVETLLADGADAKIVVNNPEGWAPIIAAYDNAETVEKLLQHGANINQLSGDGTVLSEASRWDQEKTVKLLLKNKADLELNAFNEYIQSDTPLASALRRSHANIARLLLDAGADPNNPGKSKSKPEDESEDRHTYPIHLCIDNASFDDEDGKVAETLRTLLEYRPRIDRRNSDGDLPLHRILETTPVSLTRTLINAGADMESRNLLGSTALEIAAFRGNLEVVQYLISKKANIHGSKDLKAPSALRRAVQGQSCSLELIKTLVDAGANVHEVDQGSGASILYDLLKTAPRPGGTNRTDQMIDIARYLVKDKKVNASAGGRKKMYPIMVAAETYHEDMMGFLLEEGADINSEDETGRRPIHMATTNVLSSFEYLLSHDPDLTAVDKLGRNILHHAATNCAPGALEILLNKNMKGLDINTGDIDGWTPLMWACRIGSFSDCRASVELLIKHGADVWARAKNPYEEWSPLKIKNYAQDDCYIDEEVNDKLNSLLVPEEKTRTRQDNGEQDTWDDDFHRIEAPGTSLLISCNSCNCYCNGVRWECEEHPWNDRYDLCYKCYEHRSILHPEHDRFTSHGTKYRPPPSLRRSSQGSGASNHSENHGNDDEGHDDDNNDGDDSDDDSTSATTEDESESNKDNKNKDDDDDEDDDEDSDSDDSRYARRRRRRIRYRRRSSDDDDDD